MGREICTSKNTNTVEMKHRPILIVIAGPNGSGKTTITSKVLKHQWLEDAIYINPDIVAQEKFGDWNSESAIMNAVKYCEKIRESCIENNQSLIFETVLSKEDKVEFIKKAHDKGFFIRVFFVCTDSPTINASRIATRVIKGGHDVPIPKIISRFYKSIFNAIIVSKFVDRFYVYDNSIDGEEAKILFRLSDGKLIKQYTSSIPEWAKGLIPKE